MTLIATARRLMWAGFTALALVGSISIMRADQPASAQQTSRPGAPGPATPGERTSTPPETPQRPANPPQPAQPQAGAAATAPNPFASTYKPFPSRTTLIRNATIFTASGPVIDRGSILLVDGKIAAVGPTVTAPPDALIDATGKWVTPGVIDTHSHLGVYAAPGIESVSDGNEAASEGACRGVRGATPLG